MADRKEEMIAAEKARDILAGQFLNDSNISMIDIGSDREALGGPPFPLVLRIHFKTEAAKQSVHVPEQVNGFPVRVIVANYQAQ